MKPGDKVIVSITNEVLTVKNLKTFVASCYDEKGKVNRDFESYIKTLVDYSSKVEGVFPCCSTDFKTSFPA